MAPPVLGVRDVFITFGGRPLFTGATLSVGRGDKTCLVGRNGSGKSTLLKVMAGDIAVDSGEVFVQPGVRVAYLHQDPALTGATVAAYVAAGLPPGEADEHHRVDAVLAGLGLDPDRDPTTLSGGEGRRAALARALVGEPDVLLLDEPTNHLDLPTILWLEGELATYSGALVVISHDRAFLNAVSRQTLWLDRGVVRRSERGFQHFEQWQEETLSAEEAELERMDKRLLAETHWLHRGVTARRKRNMGRLRALMDLRSERSERGKNQPRALKMDLDSGNRSGALVIEANSVSKAYGERVIVRDFSTRIVRGDRVGFIGPNGAGKTTLLRMLTGDLAPDGGTIRLGTNLTPAYFDQRRAALDPEMSVKDVLTEGRGDQVWIQGQPRHYVSYMRDFLFEDRQSVSPVKALSGGERNRLLLARLFARSSNLLILDEPTNDLDMDTLDLLEEMLGDYAGTLLVVSHDRDFLDRLATSVITVEGDGAIEEYSGGYSDYVAHRRQLAAAAAPAARAKASAAEPAKPKDRQRLSYKDAKELAAAAAPAARAKASAAEPAKPKDRQRLSYKDAKELDDLPKRIAALHAEMAKLEGRLADGGLYARDPAAFAQVSARLEAARDELAAAEERWLDLEMKREELAAGARP